VKSSRLVLVILVLSLVPSAGSWAGESAHLMIGADQIRWMAAPPSLPPGSFVAVLEGDPSKPGPFTLRAKMPDGYVVPPHWHPSDERLVVISGTLGMGMGDKLDRSAGQELTAGAYAVMPMGMRHFAWARGETVIQVSGNGPFDVNYVNPNDDPRKMAAK
jgi:mannose-6-phosphate isomerase-like protein (cupin superfamily)